MTAAVNKANSIQGIIRGGCGETKNKDSQHGNAFTAIYRKTTIGILCAVLLVPSQKGKNMENRTTKMIKGSRVVASFLQEMLLKMFEFRKMMTNGKQAGHRYIKLRNLLYADK